MPYTSTMTAAEFITGCYDDNSLYNGPETITADDAAYTLRCMREDGIPIPPYVTATLFMKVWNLCYARDMRKGAAE